jgi:hypothetical protein
MSDLDLFVNHIKEILSSKNIGIFDKIIFQFHPRQPLNYAHSITDALKKIFKNSESPKFSKSTIIKYLTY